MHQLKGETVMHEKLTIVSLWHKGTRYVYAVMGQYNPRTGKTTIPAETMNELVQAAGIPDGSAYCIGG